MQDRRQFLGGLGALLAAPFGSLPVSAQQAPQDKVYQVRVYLFGESEARKFYKLPDEFDIEGTQSKINAAYRTMVRLGILPNPNPTNAAIERLLLEMDQNPNLLANSFSMQERVAYVYTFESVERWSGRVDTTSLEISPSREEGGKNKHYDFSGLYFRSTSWKDKERSYARWADPSNDTWRETISDLGAGSEDLKSIEVAIKPADSNDKTSLRELQTYSTCSFFICGNIGRDRMSSDTFSETGKSFLLCFKSL